MKTKRTKLAPQTTSPVPEFTSTVTTKQTAQRAALGLGRSVLQHIAQELRSRGEPSFHEDGSPTDQSDDVLCELASDGLKDWLELALTEGWLDRDVVNQTREELGLEPIS